MKIDILTKSTVVLKKSIDFIESFDSWEFLDFYQFYFITCPVLIGNYYTYYPKGNR